jgi:outer membrane lipoprotein SlyB
MQTIHRLLIATALAGAIATPALAREYGPEDAGRRFNDGSRVVCKKVEVQRNSRDPNRIGGTVAGAVIGGLVGNQIGSGNGRKLATVGGAVAGGAVGRHVQGKRQESRGDRVVEQRCERVR